MHAAVLVALAVLSADGGANLTDAPSSHSAHLVSLHRGLEYLTEGALVATAGLGSILAENRGTLFHEGRCDNPQQQGTPIFNSYGCGNLSIVHGMSAVLSLTSFTATEVIGAVLRGNGTLAPRTGLSKWTGYASWVLMGLQPLLGIISAYPGVIGVADKRQIQFSKDLRTVHAGVGIALVVAYGATIVFEETGPR